MNMKKTVIITGAGRGIGAATALLFAQKGFQTVIVSRTKSELDSTAIEIKKTGAEVLSIVADLSQDAQLELVFQKTMQTFGSLDILINNAAIVEVADFLDQSMSGFDRLMNINVRAPYRCSQLAFEIMKKQKHGGSIVNISSLAGIKGAEKFKGLSAYTVSKSAIVGMTEALAVEGRAFNVRVNAVAPGAVDTKMLQQAAPFLKTETKPADLAEIIYMIADAKQVLSGSVVEVHSNL